MKQIHIEHHMYSHSGITGCARDYMVKTIQRYISSQEHARYIEDLLIHIKIRINNETDI